MASIDGIAGAKGLNAMKDAEKALQTSLERMGKASRINSAADDASGMVIMDSLNSQASSLGQAIKNANDGIGMIQIMDAAIKQQVEILQTIKTKATQAATDSQNTSSRTALQSDISKLIQQLDNIANTTSYNGISLLSGNFTNKEFQIGAFSRETVNVTVGDTRSAVVGSVRAETSGTLSASSNNQTVVFTNVDGSKTTIAGVKISTGAGSGLGALAEAINKVTDATGVRARATVVATASAGAIQAGSTGNIIINNITIGTVSEVKANDSDGKLVNAINAATAQTGVQASKTADGRLVLTSVDGRGIYATGLSGAANIGSTLETYGRLTLTSIGARDIVVSAGNGTALNSALVNAATTTQNLRDVTGNFKVSTGRAIGAYANKTESAAAKLAGDYLGVGVTTKAGAMLVMDIAESALKMLNNIRAGIGSTQNQIQATVSSISVAKINVAAAASQIGGIDYAEESATFTKNNILVQASSYAVTQANANMQQIAQFFR